ncbi:MULTISPECIES: DUF3696 domain-containing protein [Bacillus]|uniref:DUF3696 domain-containing protein n=1 Tax=Bacillus cereus TaxID=1396 RepID=A0A9X7LZB5_BACCE|nr:MULTISPECIES: DUF3696 domain-containing protein [Bacillus]KXH88045.1 hypothetical protein AU379_00545 [Bacillus sp. JH7]QDZ75855.1 DUF3696 domain-containing protein [Bacillus cereus]
MINSLQLKNFKSFTDTTKLNLTPITLISGQNSIGKSSLIQSILLLKQTLEVQSPDIDDSLILNGSYVTLGDFKDILNNSSHNNGKIQFNIEFSNTKAINSDENATLNLPYILFDEINHLGINLEYVNSLSIDENLSLNIPRLSKSSIFGCVEEKKFELILKHNNDLVSNLAHKFNLDARLLTNDDFLFEVEKTKGLIYQSEKPVAFLMNTFLPYSLLFPLNEEVLKLQNELMLDILNYICNKNNISLPSHHKNINRYLTYLARKLISHRKSFQDSIESIDQEQYQLIESKIEEIFIETIRDNPLHMQFRNIIDFYIPRLDENSYHEINLKLDKVLDNLNVAKKQKKRLKSSPLRSSKILEYIDLDDYNFALKNLFKKIYYLGPLREEPKAFYTRFGASDPMYVGQKGENVAFVLKHYSKKEINTILPPTDGSNFNPNKQTIQKCKLGVAVQKWMKYLGIAENIKVENIGNLGLSIQANITGEKDSTLTNVGVGVSQILPIVVLGLSAPMNESILILEQPELHLHPYVQSRLGDFFVALTLLKKQVIAETHSEHLINRMRYHIAKGYFKYDEEISILFVKRNNESKQSEITKIQIDEYGSIDSFPDGFFDETEKQLNEILTAAFERELFE